MPRKEGPVAHGEKLSPAAEHRAEGLDPSVDWGIKILETQFGPDVVDDPVRANELRQAALRERLAAAAPYQLTPESLRDARQQEYMGQYPEQSVQFSPLSNMVDMPQNQPPVPPQSFEQQPGGLQ